VCTRRALAGLLVAVACVAPPFFAEAQEPKRGGSLRVAYGNEIANLDFYTAPGYELNWVAMNIGCGLLSITPDGKFVPSAADSWQISPDGLLYTFKLRKDVVFHDGTPLDAAAVKFSIDRIMDPATRSSMRTFYESVHSVETFDPHTVQIRLKQPYAFCSTCSRPTGWASSSCRPPPRRNTASRIASRASRRRSWDADPSGSSSG